LSGLSGRERDLLNVLDGVDRVVSGGPVLAVLEGRAMRRMRGVQLWLRDRPHWRTFTTPAGSSWDQRFAAALHRLDSGGPAVRFRDLADRLWTTKNAPDEEALRWVASE
jgi:hypothetical protein